MPGFGRRRTLTCVAVLATAVIGLAGCSMSGSDVDRTVQRPAHEVYRAFSKAIPAGSEAWGNIDGVGGDRVPLTAEVTKTLDQSIELSAKVESKRLLYLRLQFEPVQNGAATRVRADIDVDARMMDNSPDGTPWAARQLIKLGIDRAISEVAAGRSFKQPLNLHVLFGRDVGQSDEDYGGSGGEEDEARSPVPMHRGQVVPMQSGEPMVDPDAVARQHSFPRH